MRRDQLTISALVSCVIGGLSPAFAAPAATSSAPATQPYVEFLRQDHPAPVDYVLGLFEKHDMVVICERLHPESTQWDLIYDIVKDKRFISSVGHMFTEYGTVRLQPFLEEFMKTEKLTEAEVDARIIHILRNLTVWPVWENTNFYRFLKRLYALNQSLSDSERVNLHLSDIPFTWEAMTGMGYQAARLAVFTRRDKTMAEQIESQFRKVLQSPGSRKKCLVIMNYRHAFGPIRDSKGNLRGNCAEYLFQAFPGKVANVLLNTVAFDESEKPSPIQSGRWDAAFKAAGNHDMGFDFAGSPFGQDSFDMFPFLSWIRSTHRYQDVFTGFVFYKPLSEHALEKGVPGLYDGFEAEVLRRAACISIDYHKKVQRQVEKRRRTPVEKTSLKWMLPAELR